jgi:hypothetical protein
LCSGFVDYADFAGANAFIGADKTLVDTFLRGIAAWDRTLQPKYSMASELLDAD